MNITFSTFLFILVVIFMFFINHYLSFIKFKKETLNSKPNIGQLMFKPYVRIIPMHFTIIFGFFSQGLIIFMILKTIADIISDKIEHIKKTYKVSIEEI